MSRAPKFIPQPQKAANPAAQTQARLQQGLALHQQGQLAQAKAIYEQVLKTQPRHFDALILLGMIAVQTKNSQLAVDLIGKAIDVKPNHAAAHNNLGCALNDLKQHEAAIDSYERAISLKADFAEAYYNRGVALNDLKQHQAAVDSHERAITLKADYVEAFNNRGVALHGLRQHRAAVDSYERAIALKADHAEAYNNRGVALNDLKQHEAAIASYERAIALRADHAEAHNNRGIALSDLKQHEAAIASYERAIFLKADYAEAYYNCGVALNDLKQYQAAIDSYERAIALKSDYAEAYNNRGNALSGLKKYRAAIDSYERAIALKADYADPHYNRGIALSDLKQYRAAIDCYESAIALRAGYAKAYHNRGVALNALKQNQAAIESYERAIVLKADYAEAHLNLGMLALQMGNFQCGWREHEWRWKGAQLKPRELRDFSQPLWLGVEPLQGRTILLHAEQGLGDTLQFCRYMKQVSDLGARVILEVQTPLLGLLAGLAGVNQLVGRGRQLPPFNLHCPLLSLPLAFKTGLDSIPSATRYIDSPSGKQASWSARLGPKNRPRIGLVWSGNAEHKNDHNRSIALAELMRGLPGGFQYVSLQKEVRDVDKNFLDANAEILHFGSELKDFTDTAALCELMDVIVSVDTSVAHLAGALGQEVWVLLPFNPDWRWLLDRSDSPWYPTATLYRQETRDDWTGAVERVGVDLEKRFR